MRVQQPQRSWWQRIALHAVWFNVIGYLWGIAHDIAARRGTPRVKPFLMGAMVAGHVTAVYRLLRYTSRLAIPRPLRAFAFVVAPLSWAAMVYSIFVEIPLRKAWIEQGHTDQLVTTGTYALARHPGVIWFSFALIFTAIASRSKRLLIASPLMIAGDVGHVAFQDRYVLPEVFGDAYERYQRNTPFLVPTARSLRRFVRTLPWRQGAAPHDDAPVLFEPFESSVEDRRGD